MKTHKSIFWLVILLPIFQACGGSKHIYSGAQIETQFPESFTGYILLDPENGQILESYKADRYFTPASNTKILTLYTALEYLENPLPVFEVYEFGFYSYLKGTGFPLFPFPQPAFAEPSLVRTLLNLDTDTIFLCTDNQTSLKYGPGWAWDDAYYGYQSERTPISIYRNSLSITRETPISQMRFFPPGFEIYRDMQSTEIRREAGNIFFLPPSIDTVRNLNLQVPFDADKMVLAKLLEQRIGKSVRAKDKIPPGAIFQQTIYSEVPLDSLLRRMMHESDNHLAEQLLLMSSKQINQKLSSEAMIQYMLENKLQFLPQTPIWVDGSGLSRYNLNTPANNAALLERLYQILETERLFNLFPAGGESGTLKSWYAGNPTYVYAKTGTLRNNHCLSGYIRTKSGRILVFSFMHNNYPGKSTTVKEPMERILEAIYEAY